MIRSALVATVLAAGPAQAQVADLVSDDVLRICADPANSPMSHRDGSGFENRIAEHLGQVMGKPVEYTWFPMVVGFARNTLFAGKCDLVIGYAQGDELVLNTNHYYTSTHVLVVKADGPLAGVESLSDPALKGLRLGVVAGSPPASHIARHGLMAKAKPYDLMVDRRVEDPSGDMLSDIEAGVIDAAVMWGPVAGPLVRERAGLKAIPLLKEEGAPRLFYRITMGVRQGEDVWKREVNSLLRREQEALDAILREAGVPLVDDYGKALKEGG
ncbi:substrate-binding domain-containing protein [Cereibacter azotoformans]|uniref:Extracellular solute-binding protein, family 3 n=1 Tax=Cereibacter sphaeroides (strain ATCC 17025 / ATH 2.4.3) TaxID=349102 RepID=A4WTX0_CERS5|nr:substrate-binding domain-containing protein [Cereibacter azotoformans]ULB10080.1 substrate-binding domain-containing protein [Cereibacter azotoformans]